MAFGLENIDWQCAWLRPFATLGHDLAQQIVQANRGVDGPSVACCGKHQFANGYTPVYSVLNQNLHQSSQLNVRFVEQSLLPQDQAYEAFIFETRQVPTRDGLHDFFNALVWFHLPQTKSLLNQMQASEIARAGIGGERGALRDALTLFDENVLLLFAPDELWWALENKLWNRAMIELRPLWQESNYLLFGHALQEKLVSPRKEMCAHVFRVPSAFKSLSELDNILANFLSSENLATKPYCHLPVLGIPRWCTENTDVSYYQDTSVFRPKRNKPYNK